MTLMVVNQFLKISFLSVLRFVFMLFSALDAAGVFPYFPRMLKPTKAGDTAKGSVPFEEALKKLEGIVEAMEADDLPLETLLARYEEGARLVKVCQEKLAEAEVKIQQLEKNAAGEIRLKPFEPDVEK